MWYKIQKIYVGTNQVRPSGGGSFTPTANTIAYLPLNWDVVDYSSYNRSFTVLGSTSAEWTPVFETLSSWIKVANFIATNNVNSNWFAYTTNVTDMPSSWNMTVSCRMNWSWTTDYYQDLITFRTMSWSTDRYTRMVNISQSDNRFLFHGSSQEKSSQSPTVWTWYNYLCTVSGSNCYIYINGSQIYSSAYSYWSRATSFNIWGFLRSGYTNSRYEVYNWKLSEVIVENVARTAQEVADYYNSTKSKYWL